MKAGYVYIMANTGAMLEALFTGIGHPELIDDPRMATAIARRDSGIRAPSSA